MVTDIRYAHTIITNVCIQQKLSNKELSLKFSFRSKKAFHLWIGGYLRVLLRLASLASQKGELARSPVKALVENRIH